jgi:hypothetical protein
MALKSMSIEKLVALKGQVEAALSSKVLEHVCRCRWCDDCEARASWHSPSGDLDIARARMDRQFQ